MTEASAAPDHHFRYAIGVGSNRGDRAGIIREAARLLTADGSCALLSQSALSTTSPVGGPPGQGDFLNGAWLVATAFGPHQLLARLQTVETALGRVRPVRWGSRTLDLDLLLRQDGLEVATPVLTLPHPRLAARAFVLQPLSEVVPDWTIRLPAAAAAWMDVRKGGAGPPARIAIRDLLTLMASQPHLRP